MWQGSHGLVDQIKSLPVSAYFFLVTITHNAVAE